MRGKEGSGEGGGQAVVQVIGVELMTGMEGAAPKRTDDLLLSVYIYTEEWIVTR